MIKEREIELKTKLKNVIKEIGHLNNIKQSVMDEFKLRNLSTKMGIRASDVFTMRLDLDTLTDSENDVMFLFLFCLALNSALKEIDNNLLDDYKDYFTPFEITQWESYQAESEMDNIFPLVLKNVDELSENYYQGSMTNVLIDTLNKMNRLLYNPETQRGLISTKKGIRIDVDPRKVEKINKRILEGKQYADDLKFNIVGDDIQYNSKNRTLTIGESCTIYTFDGQHRKQAISLSLSENPDLLRLWPIKITHFSEAEAFDFMSQINEQTPMRKESIQPKNYSKNENLVVSKIMNLRGDLANVTKDSDSFIKNNRGLVTKIILAEAIKDNYGKELELDMNRIDIANWIVEFTNRLMAYYPDEFVNEQTKYEIKKTSYINNSNMFYGYIALSAVLKDNNDWKTILKRKIDSIDFNINNPIWRQIGIIKNNKIKKPAKKKIYDLFREV